MKILALDLATATGACIGGGGEAPRLLNFEVGKKKCGLGFFLHDAMIKFGALISQEKPDMIVFESPMILSGSTDTRRKLLGLAGVVEMLAFAAHIPIREVSILEAKKELSGHARADKVHQVAAARILGMNPATHDEADAFSVFLCAIKVLDPPLHARWHARKNVPAYQENIRAIVAWDAEKRAKKKAAKAIAA